MARELDVRRPVAGDLEAVRDRFVGDPAGWLPRPGRWRGHGTWTVRLNVGPVGRTVDCRVGPVWRVGRDQWRSLRWAPVPERDDALPLDRGLPSLCGELGVTEEGGRAVLMLHATYQPPGGRFGDAVDAAGLQAVARRTAARFLEAVAHDLGTPRVPLKT